MAKVKENISVYADKKVYTNIGESKHVNEYDLLSDTIDDEGTRTIIIKKVDKSEHLSRCKELAGLLVEKLGEGDNKLLNTMLYDTLRDYEEKDVIRMISDITKKGEPVKHREGCFKITVGDARKRNHHEIMLVD